MIWSTGAQGWERGRGRKKEEKGRRGSRRVSISIILVSLPRSPKRRVVLKLGV